MSTASASGRSAWVGPTVEPSVVTCVSGGEGGGRRGHLRPSAVLNQGSSGAGLGGLAGLVDGGLGRLDVAVGDEAADGIGDGRQERGDGGRPVRLTGDELRGG